jgi:tRNA(Ile)-lysidine synthase
MPEPLLPRVKRTIEAHALVNPGDRIVIGVSGGVDSMVLLYLLHALRPRWSLDLTVAHVNHGLRPQESEREAELVRKESEKLGVPFEYGQFDVRAFQKGSKLSPQEAARRLRFGFFDRVMEKREASKLALGHNADDQVETVLLRLLRGSGLEGLKGILPMRDSKVIRPLLSVWRREIEAFASARDVPYLLDSSNLKRDYLRNRIRLDLIPCLEEGYQPHLKTLLLRTSSILQEENDFLEKSAEEACRQLMKSEGACLSFNSIQFRGFHSALRWRILRRFAKQMARESGIQGIEAPEFRALSGRVLREPSFRVEWPGGFFVEKRYERVSLGKEKQAPVPAFEMEMAVPGRTPLQLIGKKLISETLTGGDDACLETARDTALLDYDRLRFPLKVRNFRAGDRFHPLGAGGTQKVKEFFIDHKVPRFERERVPLVVSADGIVWIVGHRIDERFRITPCTKRVLKIRVENAE